jgi:hypothetical protein
LKPDHRPILINSLAVFSPNLDHKSKKINTSINMEKNTKAASEKSDSKGTKTSKSSLKNEKLPKKKNSSEPKSYGKSGKSGG